MAFGYRACAFLRREAVGPMCEGSHIGVDDYAEVKHLRADRICPAGRLVAVLARARGPVSLVSMTLIAACGALSAWKTPRPALS